MHRRELDPPLTDTCSNWPTVPVITRKPVRWACRNFSSITSLAQYDITVLVDKVASEWVLAEHQYFKSDQVNPIRRDLMFQVTSVLLSVDHAAWSNFEERQNVLPCNLLIQSGLRVMVNLPGVSQNPAS